MEQYSYYPQVTVVPSPEEKKQIRKYYTKIAFVLFINIIIFNGAAILIEFLVNNFIGKQAWENEFFSEAFSSGIPLISEAVSVIIGIKLLGIKFKPLLHRENYDGGTVAKLVLLSLGLQTVTSYAVAAIESILEKAGLISATPAFIPSTSLPANIMMYLYACIIGPILEEMLYRGVILQSLRKYNERFAIFFSALIFGLMHQNYQQFLAAFAFGIPLAVIAVKYKSILPTIIAHIISNTSSIIIVVLMQYAYPDYFTIDAANINLSEIPSAAMAIMLINFFLRLLTVAAALIIGITAIVKGGYMTRPTPAGKNRALPVLATSPLWWAVMVLYFVLCFIIPFIVKLKY